MKLEIGNFLGEKMARTGNVLHGVFVEKTTGGDNDETVLKDAVIDCTSRAAALVRQFCLSKSKDTGQDFLWSHRACTRPMQRRPTYHDSSRLTLIIVRSSRFSSSHRDFGRFLLVNLDLAVVYLS